MKILLVTQYFYPEDFKSNDLAFELHKQGHDVTALVGIPNYPQGKYFPGYGIFKRRQETINGVKVIRVFQTPRGKNSGLLMVINYFTFVLFATLRILAMGLKNSYDVILVHETSPITQALPAVWLSRWKKIPLAMWVLDLWPESLIYAGNVHNKFVIKFFDEVTKYIYRRCDKILMSSQGFAKSILSKGNFADKLEYFPNWAEDLFTDKSATTAPKIPALPDGFRVTFAGNIGEAQDFDHVMEAALKLKDHPEIKFIIVGSGRKLDFVQQFIAEHNLSNQVITLGRHPIETMPEFYRQSDALLVSLKDTPIFALTVPQKVQTYMCSGKPILGMINGEAADLIQSCQCGLVAAAGDSEQLAQNILLMSQKKAQDRQTMGQNGRNFFAKNFNKDNCLKHLLQIIADLTGKPSHA